MTKGKATKPAAKAQPKPRAFASADAALRISAAEFTAWQSELELSNNAAARLLYVSPNTLATFRANGAPPDIARQCRAIVAGIDPGDDMAHCARLGKINAILKSDKP